MQPRLPAIVPLNRPAPKVAPAEEAGEKIKGHIRKLIWLYVILLVFEGALRKWVMPGLSNPLLIIRDPVVILIYLLALRARAFPWNAFVISLLVLSIVCLAAGMLVLEPYLPPSKFIFVTLYGFRSDFLRLSPDLRDSEDLYGRAHEAHGLVVCRGHDSHCPFDGRTVPCVS